jgi:hypothetical protein
VFLTCLDEVPLFACELECRASASCEELDAFYCSTVGAERLEACLDDCAGDSDMFPCRSGENVAGDYQCDGFEDCLDGSDETGCFFSCSDGYAIPYDYLCDGGDDCNFGDDEIGCSIVCAAD